MPTPPPLPNTALLFPVYLRKKSKSKIEGSQGRCTFELIYSASNAERSGENGAHTNSEARDTRSLASPGSWEVIIA